MSIAGNIACLAHVVSAPECNVWSSSDASLAYPTTCVRPTDVKERMPLDKYCTSGVPLLALVVTLAAWCYATGLVLIFTKSWS